MGKRWFVTWARTSARQRRAPKRILQRVVCQRRSVKLPREYRGRSTQSVGEDTPDRFVFRQQQMAITCCLSHPTSRNQRGFHISTSTDFAHSFARGVQESPRRARDVQGTLSVAGRETVGTTDDPAPGERTKGERGGLPGVNARTPSWDAPVRTVGLSHCYIAVATSSHRGGQPLPSV